MAVANDSSNGSIDGFIKFEILGYSQRRLPMVRRYNNGRSDDRVLEDIVKATPSSAEHRCTEKFCTIKVHCNYETQTVHSLYEIFISLADF